jgi:hypothetical protein
MKIKFAPQVGGLQVRFTVPQQLDPRSLIQKNAQRITELRDRIWETFEAFKQNKSSHYAGAAWSRACAEFHSEYDALAFPGGYEAGLKRIQAGDGRAIEDALTFLEVRPYFFRSQYMRTKLTRLLRHAPLTAQQAERLQRASERDKKK